MTISNRPDCAYFLLLGLCGAAFLLTIGGILTYVAFHPGSLEGRPASAMSHIPHFHHHPHPYHGPHPNPISHHAIILPHPNTTHSQHNVSHQDANYTKAGNQSHSNSNDAGNLKTPHKEKQSHHTNSHGNEKGGKFEFSRHIHDSIAEMHAAYDSRTKESLVLAVIGPLCLLMGILVTLFVGVLALRYDYCDHEPQPNIAFLRLRSELSLNLDADKNNYELLRPLPSSSIDMDGGTFSINPTGLPDQAA